MTAASPQSAPPSRPGTPAGLLLPVLAAVLGIALFSVMDALMKRASLATGVWPALYVLRLHLLRGVLIAGMASSFFYGITVIPLAEGIAISFIAPLITLGLAALVLGEVIRREAVLAALLGLGGVVVIAWGRLGEAAPRPGAALGIAAICVSAVLYAWNLIVQRQQAQLASPLEVAFSQNVTIGLVLGLAAPLAVAAQHLPGLGGTLAAEPLALLVPQPGAWPDILGAAVLSSSSMMLLAWAYARAEAQWLVPVEYTAFGWASLMGWLWFAEALTPWTLAGLVLILGGVWLGTRRTAGPAAEPQVPPA